MKQETINALRKDLGKTKKLEESYSINEGFIFEIELLPVLTKRDENGLLQEVTNYSTSLLFRNEKGD